MVIFILADIRVIRDARVRSYLLLQRFLCLTIFCLSSLFYHRSAALGSAICAVAAIKLFG